MEYDDLFYVLPDGASYEGDTCMLGAGEYAVAYHDGPASGLGDAHAGLLAFARRHGLRDDGTLYEVSALKLLDQEDRYRYAIEMRALAA